ncbi:MAG: hypothetical protein WED11_00320, partial [Natronospirillum sp.]
QHAHRLREMLEQQGFNQVSVDVSEHSERRGQQQASEDEPRGQGFVSSEDAERDDHDVAAHSIGLVDHYV